MKTPKLLPWHAHRAGIPLERAEALWREAVERATSDTGWVGNTSYWIACEEHFLALLEDERQRSHSGQLRALLRTQHRIGRLPLQGLEDIVTRLRAHSRERQVVLP